MRYLPKTKEGREAIVNARIEVLKTQHNAEIDIENLKKFHDEREAYKAAERAKGKTKSSQAMAADAIRTELKQAFPGVKFSVTSEGYSMGDSVNIKWEDGPTTDQVEAITGKYQYGHFDGMTDMYEYSNDRSDIPQSKYVFENRYQSDASKQVLEAAALTTWPGTEWQDKQTRERCLGDLWRKTSLPAGAIVTGIEWQSSGDVITFTAPQTETKGEDPAPNFEKQEVKTGEVQIIDYSEKAFAVIGDTKPIKDKLSELGGKFNARLSCGPGWIFSKKRLDSVQRALSSKPVALDVQQTHTHPGLADEIGKTLEFFADVDGMVTPSVQHAAQVQGFKMLTIGAHV